MLIVLQMRRTATISELNVTSICSQRLDSRGQLETRAPRYVPRSRFSNASAFRLRVAPGLGSARRAEVGLCSREHRVDAIAFDALSLHERAQFDQIVRRRQHDDQRAGRFQHARAFSGFRRPWMESTRSTLSSCSGRRRSALATTHVSDGKRRAANSTAATDRSIPMPEIERVARQAAQHLAGPRAEIDGDGVGWQAREPLRLHDRIDDGASDSCLLERCARVDRRLGVTCRERTTVLRLQQVDVAAARDVERMAGGADERRDRDASAAARIRARCTRGERCPLMTRTEARGRDPC